MNRLNESSAKEMEGCVMLALSTFRKSRKAEDAAIKKAREVGKLFVAYVADLNLARYYIGTEQRPTFLEANSEERLHGEHVKAGCDHLKDIADRAEREGIKVGTYFELGRFALVCLDIVEQVRPSQIVTTRSLRPDWVKSFFGSPVEELTAKAGCPVVVV